MAGIYPRCVSWHQRLFALCGVLPSPPCCARGCDACRLHAESALPLMLGPTSPPHYPLALHEDSLLGSCCLSYPCPLALLLFSVLLSLRFLLSSVTVFFADAVVVNHVRFTTKEHAGALMVRTSGTDANSTPSRPWIGRVGRTFTSLDWTSWCSVTMYLQHSVY